MDPATSGPVVYENMETSAEGIFASGNVVHVHDLVDFVTAESQKAGKSAAEYVKMEKQKIRHALISKMEMGSTESFHRKYVHLM